MLAESLKDYNIETANNEKPYFGILAHGYQPPRLFNVELTIAGKPYQAGFTVAPEYNGMITGQVYKPILSETEQLPPGLITSIYAPLRSYLKRNNPDLFAKLQAEVRNTPNREYSILGDPLVHVILPLLPSDDQQMLLEAGKQAFINDFGFAPKGLWLPETAVSKEVLHNAAAAGYEFVPLRDDQVKPILDDTYIDAEHNICVVQTDKDEEIIVVLGNSNLSGFVSYTPWSTYDADEFMRARQQDHQNNKTNMIMMMDLERYGHHQIGAEEFLIRASKIQESYGFTPLDMYRVLEKFKQGQRKTFVKVKDNTSWSCIHGLARWTGDCCCDNPSEPALRAKKEYYTNLMNMNTFVNDSLDNIAPGWRDELTNLFVTYSDDIFTGVNFGPQLFEAVTNMGGDEEKAKLYLAKIEVMVGMTSCGWFFGADGRPERDIPSSMIKGVKDLFPEHY